MKMLSWLAILAMVAGGSIDAGAQTCDDPLTVDLLAGQTVDVGSVAVCNDGDQLTITYETTYPWCLLANDLHVALTEPDIPQNRSGNPIPGHFDFGLEHDCLGEVAFEIPLDEIGDGAFVGDTVAIAAHAEVSDGEREEGAWGAGTRFVQRGNWATWFSYEIQENATTCNVPGGSCTVFVTSTTRTGDLGGLDGADAICQAHATTANLDGTFRAWLSDDTGSPATRFTQAAVPYVRTDGVQVASDWTDLTDACSGTVNCISAFIDKTEEGVQLPIIGNFVWTDTEPGGFTQSVLPDSHCNRWSSSAPTAGIFGLAPRLNDDWTLAGSLPCSQLLSLYCFQQ